jgi:hypothetical protein
VGEGHPSNGVEIVTVPCGGKIHRIQLRDNGRVTFLDHKGLDIKVLATEFNLLEETKQRNTPHLCLATAAGLIQAGNDTMRVDPITLFTRIRTAQDQRIKRRKAQEIRAEPGVVLQKAKTLLLQKCIFRTTSSWGHAAAVTETKLPIHPSSYGYMDPRADAMGLPENATPKRKTAIRRKMVVTVCVNSKRWARVYLRCGGVVEHRFVLEIVKDRSPNELYVDLLEQGSGYTVKVSKAIIRRGHDGVWRIHQKVQRWPHE